MTTKKNTSLWDRHADIDPTMTKPITGKPYKGTSPNPHHVIWCLTDMFGPVGQGFGWRVVDEGFQPLGDEVLHWCRIWFWHTAEAHGFEAYGQTKAYMKTRNGFMADEDAPKKSLTDAVVKAASQIGVAANIFLGRWDDQKYVAQVAADMSGEPAFDARAAADRIIKSIEGKASQDDLTALWKHEEDTLRALKEGHEPIYLEVKAVFAKAGESFKKKEAA